MDLEIEDLVNQHKSTGIKNFAQLSQAIANQKFLAKP